MDSIVPQQQENPQYQVPPLEQKNFLNKKFIITFVILILLGISAYAGVWYWQKTQLAQEVVLTFTPKVDVTADWKTYTNSQYGFEFKYPANLYDKTAELQSLSESNLPLISIQNTSLVLELGGGIPDWKADGKPYVRNIDFTTDGYVINVSITDKSKITPYISSYKKIVVNNLNVFYYDNADTPGNGGQDFFIENPNSASTYLIMGYGARCVDLCKKEDVEKLFNEIMSTIKFI